jgi:hypothetical protein
VAPGTLATVRPLGSIEEPWKKSNGILVAGEGPLRPFGCGNGKWEMGEQLGRITRQDDGPWRYVSIRNLISRPIDKTAQLSLPFPLLLLLSSL